VLGNDGNKTKTKTKTKAQTTTEANLLTGGIMTEPNPMRARDLSDRNGLTFKIDRRTFKAQVGDDGRWYGHEKVSGRIKDDFSYASRGSMRRSIMDRIRALYPGVEFVK
jgi:hypothetical protein